MNYTIYNYKAYKAYKAAASMLLLSTSSCFAQGLHLTPPVMPTTIDMGKKAMGTTMPRATGATTPRKVSWSPTVVRLIDSGLNDDRAVETFNTIIKRSPDVEELDLSGNNFTSIPESIGKLTKLKRLCLSRNKLTHLPAALANLPCLEFLILDGNNLTELPDFLGNLAGLTLLNASANELTQVPAFIKRLKSLTTLALSDNLIAEISASAFDKMPRLEHLFIADNHLSTVSPALLGSFNHLKTLDLSCNNLTTWPQNLPSTLRVLDLHENELTHFPNNAFTGMNHLLQVDLSNNLLEDFSSSIGPNVPLAEINLTHNKLTPETIQSLSSHCAQRPARIRLTTGDQACVAIQRSQGEKLVQSTRSDLSQGGAESVYALGKVRDVDLERLHKRYPDAAADPTTIVKKFQNLFQSVERYTNVSILDEMNTHAQRLKEREQAKNKQAKSPQNLDDKTRELTSKLHRYKISMALDAIKYLLEHRALNNLAVVICATEDKKHRTKDNGLTVASPESITEKDIQEYRETLMYRLYDYWTTYNPAGGGPSCQPDNHLILALSGNHIDATSLFTITPENIKQVLNEKFKEWCLNAFQNLKKDHEKNLIYTSAEGLVMCMREVLQEPTLHALLNLEHAIKVENGASSSSITPLKTRNTQKVFLASPAWKHFVKRLNREIKNDPNYRTGLNDIGRSLGYIYGDQSTKLIDDLKQALSGGLMEISNPQHAHLLPKMENAATPALAPEPKKRPV